MMYMKFDIKIPLEDYEELKVMTKGKYVEVSHFIEDYVNNHMAEIKEVANGVDKNE